MAKKQHHNEMPEILQRLQRLYENRAEGITIHSMAEELGIPYASLYRLIHRTSSPLLTHLEMALSFLEERQK